MNKIAIFKAESVETESDPYVSILNSHGMNAIVIPTLEFNFINSNHLLKHLQNINDFQGMIFTSTRAVEAVHKVSTFMDDNLISKWREKKIYCVGESTSKLANSLMQFSCLGKESGNSEQLCGLILGSVSDSNGKSFLFPASDKRRETLPKTLQEKGFNIVEITCYETQCHSSLKDNWNKISDQGLPQVLVFFSPSGVLYSHELVKKSYLNKDLPKIVAIGPSTEKSLIEVSLPPCKVASKPNPVAVYEAITHLVVN